MFKMKDNQRMEKSFRDHRKKMGERSKTWGKTKFTPKPYSRPAMQAAPVEETAKPWQHVKNDILDDEQGQRSADRFDMESQQAKEFLKQREQNHRRSIIESNRKEKPTWASFDDDNDNAAGTTKAKKSKKSNQLNSVEPAINPEDLNFNQRNFIRKKLTRAVLVRENEGHLSQAIVDMKRNDTVHKSKKPYFNSNNKFRNM